ncbi:MAG: 4Fe-4S binding protein [Deltaproteobacteria bacterium]|nr:4Fe-4S binding protein [Deltaproteobacteria bacterium]
MPSTDNALDIHPEACLHSLFKDYKKHPCLDSCPQNAIELRPLNINMDLCDGCGICASVCPADALSIKPAVSKNLIKKVSPKKEKKLTIHCSIVKGGSMEVPCLGMLDDRLLIGLMAQRGGDLELISGACDGCEKKPGGEIALQKLEGANNVMSLFGRKERAFIVPHKQLKNEAPKGYTRRGLFTSLGSGVSGFISNIAEVEDVEKWQRGTTTIKRKHLLELIESLGDAAVDAAAEGALPFHGKEISPLCDGCGGLWHCATFCPTGALSLSDKEKRNEVAILFEAGRCIDCKICEMVCNKEAIRRIPVTAEQLAHLSGKESLVSLEVGRCVECGSGTRTIEEKLCTDCAQRQRKMGWDIR